MKSSFKIGALLLAASWPIHHSWAQEVAKANTDPNRFSLSARFGLNIDAKFKNIGGVSSVAAPGPATGGNVDRSYDDGFVRVDGSGNNGGLTWFWGYDSSQQIVGDNLELHASNASTGGTTKRSDDPQFGFELAYARTLGGSDRVRWGLEAAFGFLDVSIDDNRSWSGNLTRLTDSYPLGGIVPPQGPYAGSFAGPGALIGSTPTRTEATTPGGILVAGRRELESQLYGLRLGPYVDFSLSQRFSAQIGAGLALGVVDSKFSFSETLVTPSAPAVTRSASASDDEFLVGAYVDTRITCAVSKSIGIFAGAQYQYLGNSSVSAGGKEAELDLSKSVFVTVGLSFSF